MNIRCTAALAVAAFAPLAAWAQVAPTLVYGTDTDRRDQFGSGAALLGDRLFVGAMFADLGLPCEACEPGAAYVFEPGGATPWVQTARLSPVRVPADYREPGLFGGEVDACETNGPEGLVTYLAVGAANESFGYEATGSPPPDSLFNGAVYVYRQATGGAWTLDRRFRDSAPQRWGYLGSGVALICEGPDVTAVSTGDLGQFVTWHRNRETGAWSGDVGMRSGAWGSNSDNYWIEGTTGGPNGVTPVVLTDRRVLRRSGGVGTSWSIETTLPLPAVSDQSRYTFIRGSIDGDWIVVSYSHNWAPFTDSRAYVYHYGGSGVGWVQDAEFRGIATERYFARATQIVAMPDGSALVVITRGEGYGAAGTSPATLFRRTPGGTWAEIADVANASGGIRDMTSRRLVLTSQRSSARGADAGAALVVDLTGVVAAEPAAEPTAAATVRVWPNPAAGAFQVSARVPGGGAVRVVAYDGLGRLVAVLGEGMVGEGTALVARVEAGRLAAGVYVVRADGPGGASASSRVVVLR